MTESDWAVLLRWIQDPRVLVFWDSERTDPWSLEALQGVYRRISQSAFMFMIEFEGKAVGEAWLQRMNLDEVREQLPGMDIRRIDLSLGEPSLWNRGLGTEVVRALVDVGFRDECADVLFACHVADNNPRSRRVFEKNGFVDWKGGASSDEPLRSSGSRHLILPRTRWSKPTD